MDPFWGLPILFLKETSPKTGPFLDPKMDAFLYIFAPFDAIFCGVFLLPSATDVVFLRAC